MKVKYIKSTIASGILLLLVQFTHAQKLELVWGQETKKKGIGSTLHKVVSTEDNHYKVVFGPEPLNNNPKYQKSFFISNNINHTEEYSFELPTEDKEMVFWIKNSFFVNGNLRSFVQSTNKKTRIISLYCLTIDKAGKIIDKKLMTEMPYQHSFNGQVYNSGRIDVKHLKERNQFLVVNSLTNDKKETDELNFKLYDMDLNLSMNKVIKLPYPNSKFDWVSYQIDESNNIYIEGNFIIDKNTVKKALLVYKKDEQKPSEIPVDFGNANVLSNVKFSYNNGSLNFIGFYHGEKEGLLGVCVTKIDANSLKTTVEELIPFSPNDLLKFGEEKQIAKDGGLKSNFNIEHVIENKNGEILIIAEPYKSITTSWGKGDYTTKITLGNIMVIKVNKNNQLSWVSNVNKTQISSDIDASYTSFTTMMDDANLYIIYNDHIKNSGSPNGEWGTKIIELDIYHKETVITAATINLSDGAIRREVIYNPKEKDKNTFMPRKSFKLNQKQLLTYGQRGNKFKFGILTLQ